MFGKKLSEYVRFQWCLLLLIVAAFLIRMGMSLSGMTVDQVRWVSVTWLLLLGMVYCAVAVHTTGFGGYKELFGLLLVQSLVGEGLVALAIVLGILTGTDSVFTAPEV